MLVALDQIAVINRQRRELDKTKLAELALSIRESGLLQPIILRSPHEGEDTAGLPYVLVVGGRRIAAHIYLGLSEIRAELLSGLDVLAAEIAELDENLHRDNLSWQDEIDAKARIHALRLRQNPLQTLVETAAELDEDGSNLGRDLRLSALLERDPELRKATSKASALRQATYKNTVKKRMANMEEASETDLRKKLVTADWLDYLRAIPDKSIPLILSDLPYGIDQFEVQSGGENHISKFDDSPATVLPAIEKLIPELVRVIKPNGWICLFMSYEYHDWLQNLFVSWGLKPECPPWIWARPGPGNYGHYPELHAANRYELMVVVNGGEAKLMKKPVENIIICEAIGWREKSHNHQKPHELLKELISRFTVPGELVIDICFGSGAHLAAAADMGRDFGGCEKNPIMLESAILEVSQYYRTGKLLVSGEDVDRARAARDFDPDLISQDS